MPHCATYTHLHKRLRALSARKTHSTSTLGERASLCAATLLYWLPLHGVIFINFTEAQVRKISRTLPAVPSKWLVFHFLYSRRSDKRGKLHCIVALLCAASISKLCKVCHRLNVIVKCIVYFNINLMVNYNIKRKKLIYN